MGSLGSLGGLVDGDRYPDLVSSTLALMGLYNGLLYMRTVFIGIATLVASTCHESITFLILGTIVYTSIVLSDCSDPRLLIACKLHGSAPLHGEEHNKCA